ncbi:MAG: asparagine synthase (glutamine-hydrolyzing) [Bacteroidetes bacterium 4572_117]|nr:MAG: asparagine synthase (glutamine-hydrolyzing) [Bacteroidetes bacterium 4572_117]
MCGISVIINKEDQKVKENEIKAINDLINHRGPDSEGYYYGDNFAFGHKRLSIIDLSDEGNQPMHYLNKYTIIFNGEIYNYVELKEDLVKEGYKFKSNSDTEVILASYDKWGQSCVTKFNGMWSFVLFDKTENILFCSRDRFGIKPFYYTNVDNKMIIGSEIKQLLKYHQKKYVNKQILMDYLVLGFEDHTNETFFENIFTLLPSHNLIYNLNRHSFKIKRYYDIKIRNNINKLNESESVKLYKNSLINSIKLRLRSDVKVGTCLSGGLDSSSISSIASQHYNSQNKFTAIHAKSTENKSDESMYAEIVSKKANLDLKIVEPTVTDFIENLDKVIYTQEEPFGSPSVYMQYFVMKKANMVDCKVMLDGQGGDETLLGYERYFPAYLSSLNIPDRIKGFFQSKKNSKLSFIDLFLYSFYFTNHRLRLLILKRKHNFVKKKYFKFLNIQTVIKNSNAHLNIFDLQKIELESAQLPHLLKYEDKNSMAHSVETRLPFIDYKLLENALSINSKMKIMDGWTKYVLRKSIESFLPVEVVWRKNKFGFEAPEIHWVNSISDEIKDEIRTSKILKDIINWPSFNFKKLDIRLKWKLFNIARWEKLFNVCIR